LQINLDNVSIILVRTCYPGNIGSAARGMMNFGLGRMILVNPQCSFTDEAYQKARTAAHIFQNAPVYDSLPQVARDFDILVGTSRRGPERLHMMVPLRDLPRELAERYNNCRVGIVFGDERGGLTNEELQSCAFYTSIPAHPDFESLNLAHAVTIVAYELYQMAVSDSIKTHKELVDQPRVNHLTCHIEAFLKAVDFPRRGSPGRVISDVKRMLSTTELRRTDVNLIHGFMRYMEDQFLGGQLEVCNLENERDNAGMGRDKSKH